MYRVVEQFYIKIAHYNLEVQVDRLGSLRQGVSVYIRDLDTGQYGRQCSKLEVLKALNSAMISAVYTFYRQIFWKVI